MVGLIWATRGRSWGFRFLLDGGDPNPLSLYESAFVGAENDTHVYRRIGNRVALRIVDPLNRKDAAGRIIPHDFVISGSMATSIQSADDGLREIWPLVADAYSAVWDSDKPPSTAAIRSVVLGG